MSSGAAHVPTRLPLPRTSVAWRVNSEPIVFAGGGRALLLQVAHPAVGAGVEQHSSYASDPWGRLFRTVDIMMKLSFASPEVSARQQRVLQALHRRVNGLTDDGTAYRALEPALLLWVWATLVDTALVVYERVHGPLRRSDRERYLEESKLVAYGCGVPEGGCPETWADFVAYADRVVAEDLRVTNSARAVAATAMAPPLPGPLGAAAGAPNRLATIGLLPPSLREQFGYRWSDADQRRLNLWFGAVRGASRVTPAALRRLPTELVIKQRRPPRVPWLRRQGAEITARRLEDAGLMPSVAGTTRAPADPTPT
jgi:uncharacterized protein (DUF2236 family)